MKTFRKTLSILLCVIITAFSAFVGFASYTTMSYSHDERFSSGYNIINVIDVSSHNGNINWSKVYADGIREVIIRVGYRGYTQGGIYADELFETNYSGAIAAGLKVGVYFYTQAITSAEAEDEANYVIKAIKGKNITLPVIYDCEYAESGSKYTGRLYDAKLMNIFQTLICLKFLDTIKAAGYQPMLYANKYMLTDKMSASSIESNYPVWLAEYKSKASYTGSYTMWQYTPSGKVDGISGNVDMNFRYVKKEDIKKIEVSTEKTEITAGETLQAKAATNAEAISEIGTAGAVTWSSSAPEIATVDANGLITAVAAGTAEISASVLVTPAQGSAQTFSDKLVLTVNAVQQTDPTPTDPIPTDPTPTDPIDDDPVEDDPVDDTDDQSEDGIIMQILNMFVNIIVWCINAFGKLIAAM